MRYSTTSLLQLLPNALIAVVLGATGASAGDIGPARQAELRHLVVQDCGSCHGMTMKGGLGSSLLPADLADVAEESIVQIVLDGVPGTPMPPWRGLLSESEAAWIARTLKKGTLE